MAYYWIITCTNDLPPDLSFADGDDIDGLDAYMGKASCATIARIDAKGAAAMRPELRALTTRPVDDWMWCEQLASIAGYWAKYIGDEGRDAIKTMANDLMHRPMIASAVRSVALEHDPLRVIRMESWTLDPEDGSAMRHGHLHTYPGLITIVDPRTGDERSAQAAAERIRHAGMTGVNLARAVSKIAQLSPMGEPLARILGVTIDPYVV
jgi:hypothetical protein